MSNGLDFFAKKSHIPEIPGCKTGMTAEKPAKISNIAKAQLIGNFSKRQGGFFKHSFSFKQFEFVQIFARGTPENPLPVPQKVPAAETVAGGKFIYIALFGIVSLQIRGYIQDFFVNSAQRYLSFRQQQHSFVYKRITDQVKFIGKTRFAQAVARAFQQLDRLRHTLRRRNFTYAEIFRQSAAGKKCGGFRLIRKVEYIGTFGIDEFNFLPRILYHQVRKTHFVEFAVNFNLQFLQIAAGKPETELQCFAFAAIELKILPMLHRPQMRQHIQFARQIFQPQNRRSHIFTLRLKVSYKIRYCR